MFTGSQFHQAEDYAGQNGGERIQAAIEAAAAEPGHSVVVVGPSGPDADGRWVLTRAIELPSHTTLMLVGAYLFLADKANDNLVRNRDTDRGNTDIHVIGIGGARLDGNAANQDRAVRGRDVEIWMEGRGMPVSRSTKEVTGNMSVAEFEAQRATHNDALLQRNIGIQFHNVDHLSLRGFAIGPTNAMAIRSEGVRDVLISDIILTQDGREPNQDGIQIHGPAERVAISNIVGTCGDDAVNVNSKGGAVTGVTVTNVVIRNRWCVGLLRTVPIRYPIDGIYASNLQLLGGEGYSEAHAVLKFGHSRPGIFEGEMRATEMQSNITVENVFAKDWRGPYCAVFSPAKNLTIRGARGSHTGPFFHNLGQAIDGLVLEDCRTTMIGGPEESHLTAMMQFCIEEFEYDRAMMAGTPAAITLHHGPVTDVEIRDVSLRSALKPGDRVTGTGVAGLRLAGDARLGSLQVSGLTIEGYETGVLVEEGAQAERLGFKGLTMRGVRTAWATGDADVQSDNTTLAST